MILYELWVRVVFSLKQEVAAFQEEADKEVCGQLLGRGVGFAISICMGGEFGVQDQVVDLIRGVCLLEVIQDKLLLCCEADAFVCNPARKNKC